MQEAIPSAAPLDLFSAQPTAAEFMLDLYLISDRHHFQQLLDGSTGLVVVVDASGTVRYLSPMARPLFADLCSTVLGQSMLSYVHRKDLYYVMRGLKRLSSGRESQTSWIFRLLSPQGHWRWFKAVAVRFSYSGDEEITAIFLHRLASSSVNDASYPD